MSADPRKFAVIAVPRPGISLLFYKNPAFLNCSKGDCVEIELKNMKIWGIVEDFCDELPEDLDENKIKTILGRICSSPVFADRKETDFLKWVADYYMFPFHKLLKQIFLPLIGSDNALIGDSSPEKHLGALCKAGKLPETELNQAQKRVVDSVALPDFSAIKISLLPLVILASRSSSPSRIPRAMIPVARGRE